MLKPLNEFTLNRGKLLNQKVTKAGGILNFCLK